MIIDDKLIQYLETLSRLTLTDEEKEQVKTDLSEIIGYMARLNELDTTGCPELSHPFTAVNRFREDVTTNSLAREKILANVPVKDDVYFKVPKTVE